MKYGILEETAPWIPNVFIQYNCSDDAQTFRTWTTRILSSAVASLTQLPRPVADISQRECISKKRRFVIKIVTFRMASTRDRSVTPSSAIKETD